MNYLPPPEQCKTTRCY